MSCIRKHAHEAPSKCESPIEELIGWRTVMERELPYGNITSLMHARNCVGTYRDKLSPEEWFRCPSCGGRGLWVDSGDFVSGTSYWSEFLGLWVNSGDRNRYCKRCSGTGILLVCEQDVPKSGKTAPTGWRSRLRRLGHPNLRKDMTTRGRS